MHNQDIHEKLHVLALVQAMQPDEIDNFTLTQGVAEAPTLEWPTVEGMWLFHGVQVDPYGFRPQGVALLAIPDGPGTVYALIVSSCSRLIGFAGSPSSLLLDLEMRGIKVALDQEVGDGR